METACHYFVRHLGCVCSINTWTLPMTPQFKFQLLLKREGCLNCAALKLWVSKRFVANGHTRYCWLVRGPRVEKIIIGMPACLIIVCSFTIYTHLRNVAAGWRRMPKIHEQSYGAPGPAFLWGVEGPCSAPRPSLNGYTRVYPKVPGQYL